jgi:hypothetical protein
MTLMPSYPDAHHPPSLPPSQGQLANECEDVDSPTLIDLKGRHVLDVSGGGQHTIFLIRPKI